ncbi:unnamed protein product [Clavelina lepadiformis]|uniref:P-type ATPase N-terminal domain-containing protein n=1 Tax=Clavelina lepadiformis TaxID=159417 RepID=A0ABP0H186_CLALP
MTRFIRPNVERREIFKTKFFFLIRWLWQRISSHTDQASSVGTNKPLSGQWNSTRRSHYRTVPNHLDAGENDAHVELNDLDSPKPEYKDGNDFCRRHHPKYERRVFSTHNNKIRTTKYTILSFFPKNIFEQFHRWANFYFVVLIILNWVPSINAFGKEVCMIPLIIVLAVLGGKDAFEDLQRYRMDSRINDQLVQTYYRAQRNSITAAWPHVD